MSYLILLTAVLLGYFLVINFKPNKVLKKLLLAFSGAYLLAVTVLHLFPEVYAPTTNEAVIGVLILTGIILQSVLESFSKGVEHGHAHIHNTSNTFQWVLYISLCIHAFVEGLPVHNTDGNLLWAIVIHKLPVAFVLTTFLKQSNLKPSKVFLLILIFGLMSPIGVAVGDKLVFFKTYHKEITAIVIGIFLHISTIILFESSDNHSFNFKKFAAILIGFLTALMML